MPGVSREWVRSFLRDCGQYGLELALLVIAWVKARRPSKPARYARVSLAGWLIKLQAGELTVEDVRAEVHGRSVPRLAEALRPRGVPGAAGKRGLDDRAAARTRSS